MGHRTAASKLSLSFACGDLQKCLPVFCLQHKFQFKRRKIWSLKSLLIDKELSQMVWQNCVGTVFIALNHAVEWPPRLPDLTPLDFFQWGYLKCKIFQTSPKSLEQLELRINTKMNHLRQDQELVRRADFNMLRRARVCSERNGGNVND